MDEHSNGRENATQLEQRLSDYGVLHQSAQNHGFIVIGDDRVFIVKEESPTKPEGFSFEKIPFDNIESFRVEQGTPDAQVLSDDAEKVSDGGNDRTTTHIRLHLASHAVDFYADADPREVASAFVTFTLEQTTEES